MTAKIKIDNCIYIVLSALFIPKYMHKQYLNHAGVVLSDPPIYIPNTQECMLCHRDAQTLKSKSLIVCDINKLNKKAGYALKICPHCSFWGLINLEGHSKEYIPEQFHDSPEPEFLNNFL